LQALTRPHRRKRSIKTAAVHLQTDAECQTKIPAEIDYEYNESFRSQVSLRRLADRDDSFLYVISIRRFLAERNLK